MTAVRDDLVAWRHAPFGYAADNDWIFVAENLTSCTAKMQLRPTPGDTATALVTLTQQTTAVQGLLISYNASYPDPDTGAIVGATIVRPQIDKATLEALATASDPTQPLVLAYDLKITPSGGTEAVRVYGNFSLYPGVTN